MDFDNLNQYYRQHRADFPESFRLRIHRSLSWLARAQTAAADHRAALEKRILDRRGQAVCSELQAGLDKAATDWDMAFATQWIAFNAAYARDWEAAIQSPERHNLRQFLCTVCRLDEQRALYRLVWEEFSDSIRLLLDNRYVFQAFWDFQNGNIGEAEWLERFDAARKRAQSALANQDTETVLSIVFDRLYTLRNQIVHGGATWNSSANRSQLRNGYAFLAACIPAILYIMMQHPYLPDWGKPFYPFVRE